MDDSATQVTLSAIHRTKTNKREKAHRKITKKISNMDPTKTFDLNPRTRKGYIYMSSAQWHFV